MKKLINTSGVYGLLALISGVFYREFTKYNNFMSRSVLSLSHVHLMILGFFMFLVLALFSINTDFTNGKNFKKFYYMYNLGLLLMVISFYIKGIIQVLKIELSRVETASLSGISAISHVIIAIALIYLFINLKNIRVRESL